MSLISDFDLAWKSYEDKLTSYVAKNAMNNKMTDVDDFNDHYKRTIEIWNDESKVQGGFVSKYAKEAPNFCAEFFSILNNHQFQGIETPKISFVPYIAMLLAIMAIGGLVGYFVPASFVLKQLIGNLLFVIIAVVVFTAVGGGIVKALYEKSVSKKCAQLANYFYSQIENLHTNLKEFCSKY